RAAWELRGVRSFPPPQRPESKNAENLRPIHIQSVNDPVTGSTPPVQSGIRRPTSVRAHHSHSRRAPRDAVSAVQQPPPWTHHTSPKQTSFILSYFGTSGRYSGKSLRR